MFPAVIISALFLWCVDFNILNNSDDGGSRLDLLVF
jgi:hypothetical protein